MPALAYWRGELPAFVRDILDARAAGQRGIYRREHLDMLFTAPEM